MKIRSFNKIAVFSAYIPPYASGSGINAFNFVTELSSLGLSVQLYSFNWFGSNRKTEKIRNFKVTRIRVYDSVFYRVYLFFYFIPVLLRHKYFLFFGCFPGYLILMFLIILFRKKIVFQSTNYNSDDLRSILKQHILLKRIFSKFLFSRLDIYHSLTEDLKNSYLHVFPDKGHNIFHSNQGVNIDKFVPDKIKREEFRKSIFKDKYGLIIVSVGNLIKRKGYEEIFRLFHELKLPYYYIVIGNTGVSKEFYFWQNKNEMSDIFQLGNRLLRDKVYFTDFIAQSEVIEYYQKADIFLLNSVNEGLPNSLLEGMACGLIPLIRSTDGFANSIISTGETGMLFNDMHDLNEKLSTLFHDPKLRQTIEENSREYALANFNIKEVIKSLFEACGN